MVALIFFSLGYLIGSAKVSPTGKLAISANTFQAGWEAAKKRLADSGFAAPMANLEINNVSGQVTAIQDNAITLKIRPMEPLADPSLDERIVKIDNQTKIYVLEQKDQALYQKEMADFNKKIQEQMKNPPKPGETPATPAGAIMPPDFFVKKEASISDIKVGMNINVIAADKDIKNAKQFSAAEINIQSAPVAPPASQ